MLKNFLIGFAALVSMHVIGMDEKKIHDMDGVDDLVTNVGHYTKTPVIKLLFLSVESLKLALQKIEVEQHQFNALQKLMIFECDIDNEAMEAIIRIFTSLPLRLQLSSVELNEDTIELLCFAPNKGRICLERLYVSRKDHPPLIENKTFFGKLTFVENPPPGSRDTRRRIK